MIEAREAGDSEREPTSMLVDGIGCHPLRGLEIFQHLYLRVPLAKPRSTPGFMPAPASRAAIITELGMAAKRSSVQIMIQGGTTPRRNPGQELANAFA